MKVLFFFNLVPEKLGALEWMLIAVGEEFRRHDDELVLAFAAEPVEDLGARFREAGLRWHVLEGWSEGGGVEHPWAYCLPALRTLKVERPDVAAVHFGNELPALVTSLLAPLVGVRRQCWVWQQHQQIQDPGWLGKRISRIRLLSLRFDHFIGVYTGGKRSMCLRGVPENRVSVNHNAIHDQARERSPGWLRQELELPEDSVLIATTGWIIPRKRMEFIVRGFANVVDDAEKHCALLIVGDGPEKDRLSQLASDLGISDRVAFLGLRRDVREVLFESDLLVHASLAETCTYAITESMAVGIPAVVTEAGAAHEQIASGESGWVVARDDAEGFAKHLLELADDAPLRHRLGTEARKRFEQSFRIEQSAEAFHETYRQLAADRDASQTVAST